MSVDTGGGGAGGKSAGGKPAAGARFRPSARHLTALCWLAVAPSIGWLSSGSASSNAARSCNRSPSPPHAAAWAPVPLVLALALRR